MTPDEFINRMLVLYGAPETADTDMFFNEYRAVIGKSEPRVLAVAASIIRDEHEYKNWPVPAMVRKAIASASVRVHGPAKHEDKNWQNPRANPSEESRQRVQEMVSEAVHNMGGDKASQPKKILGVSRPEFEAMQRNSPNQELHRNPQRSLTERSRRMQGDQ